MVLHLPFPQKVSRSPRMCISKDPKDTLRIKTVALLLLRWEPEPERRWDVEDGKDRQKGKEKNTQVRHRTQREAAGQNNRTNTVKTPEVAVSLLLQGIQAFGDDFWHVIV